MLKFGEYEILVPVQNLKTIIGAKYFAIASDNIRKCSQHPISRPAQHGFEEYKVSELLCPRSSDGSELQPPWQVGGRQDELQPQRGGVGQSQDGCR